jgi:hypothetical protein
VQEARSQVSASVCPEVQEAGEHSCAGEPLQFAQRAIGCHRFFWRQTLAAIVGCAEKMQGMWDVAVGNCAAVLDSDRSIE